MRRFISITTTFLSLIFCFTCSEAGIPQDCHNLLLKEKWQALFETLKKDDSLTADPVARLLMGHACLANNRNNESILLFLSAKDEEDLSLWSKWTESFLRRHSKNPVALYLSADAKARIGRLDEANEAFTQALRIRNNFALALNARGVVRVLNNECDEALIDFYQATTLAPELADAHANLGTYWVIKEVSGTGALDAFNHAIAINPNFALAYNGRGSLYFGSGEFEKAARDFNMAFQLSPALLVAEVNQGLTSAYASQLITLAGLTKKKPGTTLNSLIQQYPNILKEQKQDLLKMLPTRKDQAFWKKMDTFPTLSQNQISSLVKEYGIHNVHMGASLKMQELQGQIAENHQRGIPFSKKLDFSNRVSSIAFSSLALDKSTQGGWKSLLERKTNLDIGKLIGGLSRKELSRSTFLIDIPGVGWTGGARENDWGNMLRSNKLTIYIRHKGPGKDKWDPPKEPNAVVVTLPHKWDKKTADNLLLPHLKSAFSQRKDAHLIVDKNITFMRHILPIPKTGEDVWAANVTDYISKHRPSDYSGILAEHSRGTVTNRYIKDFSSFEKIIVSSPRGDDALSWINRTPNLPPTYLITGLSDATNWRWRERYGTLLKENQNLHIVQLQDKADRKTTHSRLQNLDTTGNWKVITGTGTKDLKGSLGDILTKQSTRSLSPTDIHATALLSAKYRGLTNKMNQLHERYTPNTSFGSPSHIPGYYTSTSRPLTELGALASMVDRGIKPVKSSARSALIVSQDRFRANLLQSELNKHGFQTKVILPGIDPHAQAKQWGADVILGIKDPSKKFYDDIERKIPPPFPPGGGGGGGGAAISTPQMVQPQVKENWDWGKSFIPTYPKGAPGGISTEELARSFVDKGNWPVMTSFSLFYEATTLGSKSEKGK